MCLKLLPVLSFKHSAGTLQVFQVMLQSISALQWWREVVVPCSWQCWRPFFLLEVYAVALLHWLTQYRKTDCSAPITSGLHLPAFSSCSDILRSQLSAFIITGKCRIILRCYFFFSFSFWNSSIQHQENEGILFHAHILNFFPFRELRVWKFIWLYSIGANRIQIKCFTYLVLQKIRRN